jgi:hypothetical protein
MHKFFDLHLWFFYVKNRVEKFNIKFIWLCIDVFNLIIILMFFLIFSIMFLFIIDYFFVFHLSTQLLVAYLIRCMNKLFDLHFRFFMWKTMLKNSTCSSLFDHVLVFSIWLLFLWFLLFFQLCFYLSLIIYLFTQWLVVYLIGCIHKFFYLHLLLFLCKKPHWKIQHVQVYLIMYWCFQFDHYSNDFFLYLC